MSQQHPLLLDPDNAKAYQTLCDNPRGSTRAWATKAGWTHSKMVRFLEFLKKEELCRIDPRRPGSLFIPTVPKRSETFRNADVLDIKSNSLDVSRYGDLKGRKKPLPIADPDGARLIAAMNAGFARRPESNWKRISEDNYGSLRAAAKILSKVPVDRAVPLVEDACMKFNPTHSRDGEWPHSLGHPFFHRFVVGAWRAAQKDLEVGQLNILFVETAPKYQEYVPPAPDLPIAKPETIDSVAREWRQVAGSPIPPRRL